jgi:hypothetical protein
MRELKDEELELVCGGSGFGSLVIPGLMPLGVYTLLPDVTTTQLEPLRLDIGQHIENQVMNS